MSTVYNLRSHKLDNFIVTKFDDDFNIESCYEMTVEDGVVRCGCPAGVRPTCRHRQMFAELLTRLDTAWFLDFDTRAWVDPTGEAASAASSSDSEPEKWIIEGNPTKDSWVKDRFEEQPKPDPITRLDDSHPFRRRI